MNKKKDPRALNGYTNENVEKTFQHLINYNHEHEHQRRSQKFAKGGAHQQKNFLVVVNSFLVLYLLQAFFRIRGCPSYILRILYLENDHSHTTVK